MDKQDKQSTGLYAVIHSYSHPAAGSFGNAIQVNSAAYGPYHYTEACTKRQEIRDHHMGPSSSIMNNGSGVSHQSVEIASLLKFPRDDEEK